MLEGGGETRTRGMMVDNMVGEHDLPTGTIGPAAEYKIVGEVVLHPGKFPHLNQTFGADGHRGAEGELHSLQPFGHYYSGHELGRHTKSFQLRPEISPADTAIEIGDDAYPRRGKLS